MSEAVYVVDRRRRITYWNRAAEEVSGYSASEVVGQRCGEGILNHVDEEGTKLCGVSCPLAKALRDGKPRELTAYLHHADGHRVPVHIMAAPMHDERGRRVGLVEVFHDDTRYHNLLDQVTDLQEEALTDPLTGLANRRMLGRLLALRAEAWDRFQDRYAVVYADIDKFKNFNDRYGHDTGDQVLMAVGNTLRLSTRSSDFAGRWGGEEFLVVAAATTAAEALAVAERARHLVASTWLYREGRRVGITLSVGVALAEQGERPDEVVNRADLAMLRAKRHGRDRSVLA